MTSSQVTALALDAGASQQILARFLLSVCPECRLRSEVIASSEAAVHDSALSKSQELQQELKINKPQVVADPKALNSSFEDSLDTGTSEEASGRRLAIMSKLAGSAELQGSHILLMDEDVWKGFSATARSLLRVGGFSGPIIYHACSQKTDSAPKLAASQTIVVDFPGKSFELVSPHIQSFKLRCAQAALLAYISSLDREFIKVKSLLGPVFLAIKTIAHIDYVGRYSRIHTTDGQRIDVNASLNSFEEKLGPHGFVRVHRAHLVQASFIDSVGQSNLTLADGSSIPVGAVCAARALKLDGK